MSYRRYMMSRANKLICGIDFSKQPDNEIWYKTENNTILPSSIELIGSYVQKDLKVVSHTYENGLGKVTYNAPLAKLGESAFRNSKGVIFFSAPKTLTLIGPWAFTDYTSKKVKNLIFLSPNGVEHNRQFRPVISGVLYVQPNCAQYYKGYTYDPDYQYTIIEKKI